MGESLDLETERQARFDALQGRMMSALGDAGVLGLTAVGDDHAQADRLAAAEAVRP